MPARIAIIGGGITGLAAAYHLERLTQAEITLYEASDALGGKVRTNRVGELLVEEGPDAFFTRKPGVIEMVAELGLESELIEPQHNEFFMYVGGELCRVPRELVSFKLTSESLEKTKFMTQAGTLKALSEPTQPPGTRDDESIHSFFTRRFGEEFSRLVAEPLLAGTHGGEAAALSMKALYPGYLSMERKQGSIAAGMMTPRLVQPPKPAFLSFAGGMETLVAALTRALKRTRIHLNSHLHSWSEAQGDVKILCVPANVAAGLLEEGQASALLREIEHRSSVVVTLAYRADAVDHPLDGTGFLVPDGEHPVLTGMTWSSQKWPGRAPEGIQLFRAFLRGSRDQLADASEDSLVELATSSIGPLLNVHGRPDFAAATRWIDALPQYAVGHVQRVAAIKRAMAEYPGVFLAGTSYEGVGVPDCLRQARESAEHIGRELN